MPDLYESGIVNAATSRLIISNYTAFKCNIYIRIVNYLFNYPNYTTQYINTSL